MKTALFTNFTDKEFIGHWDGKPRPYPPGKSEYMPDYIAKHFAKHLTNQALINLGQEQKVSPRKPEDVPEFMELFNKAYIPDETADEIGSKKDDLDTLIGAANKNREMRDEQANEEVKEAAEGTQNPNEPQIVSSPDFQEDDSEESFGDKPVETNQTKNKDSKLETEKAPEAPQPEQSDK